VIELPDLVALLYRADWTRLSLRGELVRRADRTAIELLTARSSQAGDWTSAEPAPQWRESSASVLVAPGARFRVQRGTSEDQRDLTVCDGESCWRLLGDWAERAEPSLADPDLAKMLDPSWLLAWYQLELAGTGGAVAAAGTSGRAAYRVTGVARAARLLRKLPERVDVLVDAELGIVLWLEAAQHGRLVESAALRALSIGPDQALDLTRFSPPPGTTAADPGSSLAEFGQLKGPLGKVVGTAADLTAGALGFAVRHAPRPAASAGPPMPRLAQPDGTAGSEALTGQEISGLHRAGRRAQDFSAEVRQWTDREVMLEQARRLGASLPQPFTGVLGPDAVWDALGEQVTGVRYRTARLRVAMPGRYRMDFLAGDWQSKLTLACDGEQLRTQYRNRVITGQAEPLDDDWARLVDPAWLLSSQWRLWPAGDIEVDGRPGLLLWADLIRPASRPAITLASWTVFAGRPPFSRVAAVLDPELGILLRWAGYAGSRQATCVELAGVRAGGDASQAEFTIEVPPGTKVVHGSSPLAHLDLRRPAEAAKAAGALGVAGAAIVSGWLQNRPGRRQPPGDDS
jgi:hypothetical protein